MKRLPIVYAKDLSGRDYWRSLGEREGSPEFRASLGREFPEGASEPPDGMTRRDILTLLGASISLAGLAACRRPVHHIVPYVDPPEQVIPGVPKHYRCYCRNCTRPYPTVFTVPAFLVWTAPR